MAVLAVLPVAMEGVAPRVGPWRLSLFHFMVVDEGGDGRGCFGGFSVGKFVVERFLQLVVEEFWFWFWFSSGVFPPDFWVLFLS